MERSKIKQIRPLLVLGCQRSGTTLLSSMLARHSEVNMLFESTSKDVTKLVGKKYQGNKLCVYRQIRIDQRSSKFGYIINRLANFHFSGKKYQIKRPYPTSELSIQDYIDLEAKIITIRRSKDDVVKSLTNRTPMSKRQAEFEFEKADEILEYVRPDALEVQFNELVNNPEKTLHELCSYLNLTYEPSMMDGPKFNIIYPNSGIIKEKASQS